VDAAFKAAPESSRKKRLPLRQLPRRAGMRCRWKLNQSVRLQHQLGQRADGGGGSLHESVQPWLATAANQHAHDWLGLFQWSALDELSRPWLPASLAL